MSLFEHQNIIGASGAGGAYEIDNSAIFNGSDEYLTRTNSGTATGAAKKFTLSWWWKDTNPDYSSSSNYYHVGNTGSNFLRVGVGAGASASHWELNVYSKGSSNTLRTDYSNASFKDPHAWHHFVIAIDTNAATAAANRKLMYHNGVLLSKRASSNFADDETFPMMQTGETSRWCYMGSGNYMPGYLAHCALIDGQQLNATSFGEYDTNGVWRPIDLDGLTFGAYGYWLKYEDSSNLGLDSSSNSNNFTATNMAATNQSADTPTNNHAVMSSIDNSATLSNGNRTAAISGAAQAVKGSIPCVVGDGNDYVFEAKLTAMSGANQAFIGVADNDSPSLSGAQPSGDYRSFASGSHWNASQGLDGLNASHAYDSQEKAGSFSQTYTTNDIIGVVVKSSGAVHFYKNGSQVFISSDQTNISVLPAGNWFPSVGQSSGGGHSCTWEFRFGAEMTHTYGDAVKLTSSTLNTAQSPTVNDGSKYFQAQVYTGNTSGQAINQDRNSTFQPDFVWIKNRSGTAASHHLYDAIRGVNNFLRSNTNAAANSGQSDLLTSFDSDGFTVGADASEEAVNKNSDTYISWHWLAGNATSTPSGGSVSSTVSVNQTAGFSIVSFTGTAGNDTVAHGLGAVPDVVYLKNTAGSESWFMQHVSLGPTFSLSTNTDAAKYDEATIWNDTAPTSTVFTAGSNTGTSTHLAYCFTGIPGYSKFGSYEGGANSTDGRFVYLGFKPAFLLIKNADNAGESWYMFDDRRPGYNGDNFQLIPNSTATDGAGAILDFISNGFKIRANDRAYGGSSNIDTYIYWAFAEHPFAGSTPMTGVGQTT